MPRTKSTKSQAGSSKNNPLKLKSAKKKDPNVHVFGNGVVCDTDTRGYATPNGRGLLELVFDASEGFIPLWAKGSTLRWRFQEHSFSSFESPAAAKTAVRKLLGKALLAWGDAAPLKFAERDDAWDFEIVMRASDRCDVNGCVLASAFFPDSGRHELRLYPKLLEQPEQEQVETLCHEIGHTFGLRHFFANISEKDWPSVIVGVHKKFTIMNYGPDSKLMGADRTDLKKLYQSVWTGHVTDINGTPVRLVKPFHTAGAPPDTMQVQANLQPQVAATPALPT
jgi:hypothetical protein